MRRIHVSEKLTAYDNAKRGEGENPRPFSHRWRMAEEQPHFTSGSIKKKEAAQEPPSFDGLTPVTAAPSTALPRR